MIKHVKIRNYKSVQSLDLDCKRYNVFVGDTSTGKSNIIEALSLMSQGVLQSDQALGPEAFDKRVVRYDRLSELFTNADLRHSINVEADGMSLVVNYDREKEEMKFTFGDQDGKQGRYTFSPSGARKEFSGFLTSTVIRRYQFDPAVRFVADLLPHLSPPSGQNLSSVLLNDPGLLNEVDEIMSAKDIFISIDRDTYRITQRIDITRNVSVHLSWATISETIKRYVFLYTAIRTNQNAVLLLDEPEQNTFPFYTAHIAEIMAREKTNQYFITTHNQYLLSALLDKAPADEIQVFATFRKDRYTEVRAIPADQLQDLMRYDLFLNLDKLAEV
jgi:AAA15 family ATPase/GTPase